MYKKEFTGTVEETNVKTVKFCINIHTRFTPKKKVYVFEILQVKCAGNGVFYRPGKAIFESFLSIAKWSFREIRNILK